MAEVVEVTGISGIAWIKMNIIGATLQICLSASFSGESQSYRSTNLADARESVYAQGHFSIAVVCTLNLYRFHICYITWQKSAQTLKSTLPVTEKETVLINNAGAHRGTIHQNTLFIINCLVSVGGDTVSSLTTKSSENTAMISELQQVKILFV